MKTESPTPADLPVAKNQPPSTLVKVWSVSIFIAPFALFGYWMFQVRQDAKAMVLSVPAERLDFGTVWMQDDFEWTIPVTNRTNRTVEILGFDSSCNCTNISPKNCSLAPGETLDFRLAMNLTPNDKEAKELIRDFSVLITPVILDELTSSHSWVIQGQVRSTVELSVPSLRFEDFLASRHDFTPKTVKIVADEQVEKIEVHCDEKYAVATIRTVDEVKREFELSVALSELIPVGPFGFKISINAFGKNGQPLPKMYFSVVGRLLANVRAIPPNLDLASIEIGESKIDTISLFSDSGRPFRILKIEFEEGAGAALVEKVVFPRDRSADSAEFQIVQTALKSGDRTTTVIFHVQEEMSKRFVRIPMIVSYCGRRTKNSHRR